MSATVKVCLHGRLKKFGGPYDWGVKTPREAIRALCIMVPGFEQEFRKGSYRLTRGGKTKGPPVSMEMLSLRMKPGTEFHIIPIAAGGKSGGGIAKALVGAVLIGAAFWTAGASLGVGAAGAGGEVGAGGSFLGALTTGVSGVALKIGAFLVFDGVSQLISPTKKSVPADQTQTQSFVLGTPGNTTEQGNPVPLVYGTMRVGSVMISAGYTATQIAVGETASQANPLSPYYIAPTNTK